MDDTINITLPGNPTTKLRPRFSKIKGKSRTYDMQSDLKRTVAWQLQARMLRRPPLQGPLSLGIVFVFSKPKSRVKLNEVHHSVKPDLDNLIKWIGDVGNGILWVDDRQIVSISSVKVYGEVPQTVITVMGMYANT